MLLDFLLTMLCRREKLDVLLISDWATSTFLSRFTQGPPALEEEEDSAFYPVDVLTEFWAYYPP